MLNIGCSKMKTLKVIFDPPAAIKGLKRSGYGQLKWLTALEYSHLRASGNPEKSRDQIFENPGIGILKKSRDPAGAWSRASGLGKPTSAHLFVTPRDLCCAAEVNIRS